MPRTSNKRDRLLDAAKVLIHRQGFFRTTLADIAAQADVPLGNVYYYFKTKEEILQTVLEQRRLKLQETLDGCETGNPKDNLIAFVRTVSKSSAKAAEFGCIIGSLCQELDRTQSALRDYADRCMRLNIDWAGRQFRKLGYRQAQELGFQLIARIEGAMLLGLVLQEPRLIKKQLRATCDWIGTL